MATDATGSPTPLGIPTINSAVDKPTPSGINAIASAVDTLITARMLSPAGPSTNQVPVWNGSAWVPSTVTAAMITAGAVADVAVSASAAIATSKLALSTARSSGASTFPVSPADGDEWTYIASTAGGVAWRFKYRSASASAYKWEFIGGSAIKNTGSTAFISAASTALTTFTLPFAGDYAIRYGAVCSLISASVVTMLPQNNGGNISGGTENISVQGPTDSTITTIHGESYANTGRAVGDILGMVITNAASAQWRNGFFTVTPIRCSN